VRRLPAVGSKLGRNKAFTTEITKSCSTPQQMSCLSVSFHLTANRELHICTSSATCGSFSHQDQRLRATCWLEVGHPLSLTG
jgi:hypothetical protein